jgi:hypothetical protein
MIPHANIVYSVSHFVSSDEGAEAQRKLWKELVETLDRVEPGLLENI